MSVTHGQCNARSTVNFPATRLVPNYTAWRQKHMCVNNLPRVALDSGEARIRIRDLLIASPAPKEEEEEYLFRQ